MNKRITTAVAVYIVLQRRFEVLFSRRCNTGYQDGNYQFPAGHVETGETPMQALMRETLEEIGVKLLKSKLRLVHVSTRPKHDETGNRVDLYFITSVWRGQIRNAEPNKCDELLWVPLDKLPVNTVPHVRHAIDCMIKGIFYSELDLKFMKDPLYKQT